MEKITNIQSLIELHCQLSEFAKFHQNKGKQDAIAEIVAVWDRYKHQASPETLEGRTFSLGVDEAFKAAIDTIQNIL